jgi:hypothetical protein
MSARPAPKPFSSADDETVPVPAVPAARPARAEPAGSDRDEARVQRDEVAAARRRQQWALFWQSHWGQRGVAGR